MKRIYRTPGLTGGFSLIEVMIAVVVLATGLLALAALQGSLTRSSAEAKTRSRVAAMLSARMDELRGSGYDNAILDPGTTTTSSTVDGCDNDATDWIDCARVQGNLGSLTVTQTNTLWTSEVGAAAFGQVANRTDVEEGNPEFVRVTLEASWTGANAGEGTHRLATTSEFSSLALRDSLLPPPPASNTTTGAPFVRTDNPAGPGVIPIAVGGGDATAASNPRPEQVGKTQNAEVVGTRFDVLTYNGLTGAAVIQRRVETAVVKCQCRLGAGGANLPEIYRASQWPAVWTGERYDVYTPNPAAPPPGQGKNSGPKPNVEQSPLCQECCRDHFDGTETTVAKFDPERSGAHDHYNISGGTLSALAANDVDYVDSCRVIRVDGFWRTAADMYSRQFGLLATETVDGKEAKSGLPTSSATNSYQTFVKDYLEQITGASGTPPANAQGLFDEIPRALNDPDDVDIATPDTGDWRFLHGRGLYLDYLEEKARKKIQDILADTGPSGACPTGSDIAECILPYLPFTTVNVTELASWSRSNTNILNIQAAGTLGTDPLQPSGGRTAGKTKGIADSIAKINMSNYGLAASNTSGLSIFMGITGVDTADAAALGTDKQKFDVGGNNSEPVGQEFEVKFSGLITQDPDTFYSVFTATAGDSASSGECLQPVIVSDYLCSTNTKAIAGGTLTLKNYWIEPSNVTRTHTALCTRNKISKTMTFSYSTPNFRDFSVTGVSVNGVPIAASAIQNPAFNDKHKSESTTVTFNASELVANAVVTVQLTEQSLTDAEKYATVTSCEYDSKDNVTVTGWNYPWVP